MRQINFLPLGGGVTVDPTVVIRVENLFDGLGPYQNSKRRVDFVTYTKLRIHEFDHIGHPNPDSDGMSLEYRDEPIFERCECEDFIFGFKDANQLNNWFEPELRQRLHDQGFVVMFYLIDREALIHGAKQVAWIEKLGKRMGYAPLVEK